MAVATPSQELDFLGCRTRILATGEPFGFVDMLEVPAGHMPPLHVHHSHDEGFMLLEGEVTIHTPGTEVVLRPGEFFLGPRGVPHTYRVGDGPARWLITSHPAGFERFVAAVAELGDADPAALTAVAAQHGIEILGPPGMLP
jgi:quercetin dioxygenase-like cupin family protein